MSQSFDSSETAESNNPTTPLLKDEEDGPNQLNIQIATEQEQEDDRQESSTLENVPVSPTSNSSLKPAQEELAKEEDALIKKYVEACQAGDLATVSELIESGAILIKSDIDSSNVSGLHWAAINNRLSIVKYLISKGADIDREGGDLNATPLHWACRYGLVYIVDYLLKNGADASKRDSQGFNALHLSVHSSNIMLVIYILVFVEDLFVDEADPNGRTALHWASYQGDSLSVDALLKSKASVRKVDDQGFTPIHWGLIRSQKDCLKRLLEQGSDINAKTNDGKNCFDIAADMNSAHTLEQALFEAGFNADGTPIYKPFDEKWAKIITFFYPYFLIGLILYMLPNFHIFITLITIAVLYLVSNKLFKKFIFPCYILLASPFLKSPFLSGIFSGTTFWVILTWFTIILPYTFTEAPFINLLFLLAAVSVVYCFQRAMFKDPGFIDPPQTDSETKAIIEELLSEGKYDAKNFCIHTYIRKPLRSKYSSFSSKCVARFDHYCPWVYNDVGLRNHKVFMFFVVSLESAMVIFVYLVSEYFDELDDDDLKCYFLEENLCAGFTYSGFTFFLTAWTSFQLIWVTFLLFSQFFQISKGVTTLELSVFTSRDDLSSNNPYYSTVPNEVGGGTTSRSSRHNHRNCLTTLCVLTGLDQFRIALKQSLGLQTNESITHDIPMDYGLKQNCIDFWFASGDDNLKFRNFLKLPVNGQASLNGQVVDYYKLYKLPEKKITYDNPV